MRDLKFKAYHKGQGKMYWFDLMWGNHNQGNGYIGMVPWGEKQERMGRYRGNMTLVDPEECEIMQFTGLIDMKGNEVYEGDIFENDSYKYVVVFGDGCFKLLYADKVKGIWKQFDHLFKESISEMKITGNIYDIPLDITCR